MTKSGLYKKPFQSASFNLNVCLPTKMRHPLSKPKKTKF